jgi:membrane-associated phospholipid phosphatase
VKRLLTAALFAAGCASAQQTPPAPPRADAVPPDPHGSVGAFVDSHFSGNAWRENVVRDYLTAPPVLLPATLAAAALAVAPWDHSIAHRYEDGKSHDTSAGDATLVVLVAGSVGTAILAPGPGRSAESGFWNQAEAFALTNAVTSGLKVAVGRHRPGSSSSTSFPSGHAANAFAAATLLYRDAGPLVGVPAFAAAGYVGLSRVQGSRHFPSDVLAGAAVGSLCAGVVDALHFGTGREGRGIASRAPDVQLGLDEFRRGRVGVVATIRF